ncbi:MAG: fatty acid desaturase [Planctomycetes bacterium]|nr:fatty acid desaturase [Planctomycetota bacterium]
MFYHLADIRVVVWVCITFALIALQWLGVVQHWAVYLPTFYFAFACKVIVHNHCHFPTLKSGWNTLFNLLLEITTLATVQFVYAIHMENHHREHMTDDDCSGVHRYSGRWALIEAGISPFLFLAKFRLSGRCRQVVSGWVGRQQWRIRELRWHNAIIYSLSGTLLWLRPWETLIYYIIPNMVSLWWIVMTNHLQHIGCSDDSEFTHSRTITGRVSNWLLFNAGHHMAHHHRPRKHWTRLPAFYDKYLSAQVPQELKHGSFVGALLTVYLCTLFSTKQIYLPR